MGFDGKKYLKYMLTDHKKMFCYSAEVLFDKDKDVISIWPDISIWKNIRPDNGYPALDNWKNIHRIIDIRP